MADNIPQIDLPTVAPQPVRLAEASPGAFGAGVGQAVSQAGQSIGEIKINERHMAAAFDAQDRELKYGLDHDKLKEAYENKIRALSATQGMDSTSFQQQATDLTVQFEKDQEQLRAKYEGTLGDPMARKAYEVRTRLQTQNAAKTMGLFADAHIRAWRQNEVTKGMSLNEERAGNATGNPELDRESLQQLRDSNAEKVDLLLRNGLEGGRPAAEAMLRDSDRRMAVNRLQAYSDKANHAAALAFLHETLSDGTHVQFDPQHPDDKFLLTTAEAKKFTDHFTEMKVTKAANNLAADNEDLSFGEFRALARETFKVGTPESNGEAYEKAMDAFAKAKNREHADEIRVREEIDHSNYQAILDYGGFRQAMAAGKIKPGGTVGTLFSLGAKVTAFNSGPIMDKALNIFNDPASKGLSLALPPETLQKVLDESDLSTRDKDKIYKAVAKDRASLDTETKAAGSERALTLVQDRVLSVTGFGRLTGKGISDMKDQRMLDLLSAAEIEFRKRVGEAPLKAGQKALDAADTLKIAAEVSKQIPQMWQDSRDGKLVVPKYDPKPSQAKPTPAQTKAAADLVQALGISPRQTIQSGQETFNGAPVLSEADRDGAYAALPDHAPFYVKQGDKYILFHKGVKQ